MPRKGYFRYRREKLFKQHPYCDWCDRKLVKNPGKKGKQQDNYATIDHLKSKYDGKREDPKFKKKTLVLACYRCNNDRSKIETRKKCKFALWWKSGAFPRWLFPLQIVRNLVKTTGER